MNKKKALKYLTFIFFLLAFISLLSIDLKKIPAVYQKAESFSLTQLIYYWVSYYSLTFFGWSFYLINAMFLSLSFFSLFPLTLRRERNNIYYICFFLSLFLLPIFLGLIDSLIFEDELSSQVNIYFPFSGAYGIFILNKIPLDEKLLILIITILLLASFSLMYFYDLHKLFSKIFSKKKDYSPMDSYQQTLNPKKESPPPPHPIPPIPPKKVQAVTEPITQNKNSSYQLPPLKLLSHLDEGQGESQTELFSRQESLNECLKSFNIRAYCDGFLAGPKVTLFKVIPEAGERVEKISNLASNISRSLKAKSIRIIAPVPGESYVGVEISNTSDSVVSFKKILSEPSWEQQDISKIPFVLGRDIRGESIFVNLTKCPHLLVAGSTGSGKSVFINTLVLSLLFRYSPKELKLVMVDPKQVELTIYKNIPHLLSPILTESKKVPSVLNWLVYEMNHRYSLLRDNAVKTINEYNHLIDDENNYMPFIVLIIDELADLMLQVGKNIEASIASLAQKARAVGIHLVLATQRPSVDVLTGSIKNNFPSRIVFRVSSLTDSRTVIDQKGAEGLLGNGDLLFMSNDPIFRVQASFVPDKDIQAIVDFCREQTEAEHIDMTIATEEENLTNDKHNSTNDNDDDDDDELIKKSIDIIVSNKKASTSFLQRKLSIGYNKAAIIMEKLEEMGIVSEDLGAGKRNILLKNHEQE